MGRVQVHAFCRMATIQFVTEYWKTPAGKVNPDLVGAACVEAAFNKKAVATFYSDFFEDAEVCFGVLASASFRQLAPFALLRFTSDAAHIHFYGEGRSLTLRGTAARRLAPYVSASLKRASRKRRAYPLAFAAEVIAFFTFNQKLHTVYG